MTGSSEAPIILAASSRRLGTKHALCRQNRCARIRGGQKNDYRDAEAIAEAVQRPTMKFVATKTVDQLDLQALHRVRERLVSQRTGIINQIRAFLTLSAKINAAPSYYGRSGREVRWRPDLRICRRV